jgi:hypothetical protein
VSRTAEKIKKIPVFFQPAISVAKNQKQYVGPLQSEVLPTYRTGYVNENIF